MKEESKRIHNGKKCSPTRVRNCLKTFFVHLFSHVGLCVLVVSYAVLGGFIFRELERKTEEDEKLKIEREVAALNATRRQYASSLWNITDRLNVLYKSNWTQEVEIVLENFERTVKNRTIRRNFHWTFTSALLYSVSIITTIGYGHIFPQTLGGNMFTMLYAVIGILIMLLWLSNIGNVMAYAFRLAYFHGPFCHNTTNNTTSLKNTGKVSNKVKNTVQFKTEFNNESISMSLPSLSQPTHPTTVQYSIDHSKYETVLLNDPSSIVVSLHQSSNPSNSPQLPSSHQNTLIKEKSNGEIIRSLNELDPATKEILIECAEYNMSQNPNNKTYYLFQQMKSHSDDEYFAEDEVDEISRKSSDIESVIEILPINDKILSTLIPPPPKFEQQLQLNQESDELCSFPSTPTKSNTLVTRRYQKSYSKGTRSKIPLLPKSSSNVANNETSIESANQLINKTNNEQRVPISLVLFVVVLYIVLEAPVFTQQESWYFWDSAYFCFITLSTIGLGDLIPGKSLEHSGTRESTVQLIFCCFYLVLGLAIIAMSFNLVQEQVTLKVTGFAKRIGIIEEDYA